MGLYRSTKVMYDESLDLFKADRDKVVLQYDKYKNVVDTVDQLFARLDLAEFDRTSLNDDPITIEHLFHGWEADLARRYVHEKLAAVPVLTP
jgi:hypothetical protein